MIRKIKAYAFTFMVSAALSIDQAFAFAWPWKPGNGGNGPGNHAAPELDGTGAIAVFALLASIAVVLFNRTRNK